MRKKQRESEKIAEELNDLRKEFQKKFMNLMHKNEIQNAPSYGEISTLFEWVLNNFTLNEIN